MRRDLNKSPPIPSLYHVGYPVG